MDKKFLRESGNTRFFTKTLIVLSLLAYLLLLTGLFKTLLAGKKGHETLSIESALAMDTGDREKLMKLAGSGFDEKVRASLSFDAGNYRAVVGALKTWGYLNQVVVRGDRAFLANGKRGLQVVDIGDPKKPRIIGSIDTSGFAWGVCVRGDFAYVADGPGGLAVLSIAEPAEPRFLGNIATRGAAYAVEILNEVVLVADKQGISAVSVHTPERPEVMFQLDLPRPGRHLAVKDGRIFLANGKNGVAVIEFERQRGFRLAETLKTHGSAERVTISGTLLLVGCGKQGVDLFELNNAEPAYLGGIDTPGLARGMSMVGNRIFVADNTFGLQIFEPGPNGIFRKKQAIETPRLAWDVVSANGLLFVSQGRGGLQIIDPALASEVSLPTLETGGFAWEATCRGNRLYLADGFEGVRIIDIEPSGKLAVVSTIDTPGYAKRLELFDDRLYVADTKGGLVVVGSIQGKGRIESVVPLPDKAVASAVSVSNNLACVAAGAAGLVVVDVADPGRPRIAGRLIGPHVRDVALIGNQAYLAAGKQGLLRVSLKNPAKPVLQGEVEIPPHLQIFSDAIALSHAGNNLLLANSRAGCQVFDVADPARPRFLSTVSAMGNVTWVEEIDGFTFVNDSDKGLGVVDLENPEKPCLLGILGVPRAKSVVVVDNQACVTLGGGGLKCVPLPLELRPVAIRDSREMVLGIPPLPVSGNYILTVFRDGEYAVMDEPVSL